ncbi:hypothetical protein F5X98DRAFT_327433 [Xylaria grammica]|nr:hypothetical protein F5X98DRAFT_327433 [Xylaria grammica]
MVGSLLFPLAFVSSFVCRFCISKMGLVICFYWLVFPLHSELHGGCMGGWTGRERRGAAGCAVGIVIPGAQYYLGKTGGMDESVFR